MSDSPASRAGAAGRHEAPARLRNLRTRLLSLAAMQTDRRVNEELARVDARKWHYAVLATLAEFGPASQAEVSSRTGIHRSDVVAVVNELATRGLVERAPNPADRRQNVITMTPPGRRRLRELDDLLARVDDEVLAPLTSRQREQLGQLLATLLSRSGTAM